MPTFPFFTADVFTTERFGGNQLAVFPDAAAIPESALQNITREFNFSETAFVYPPREARHTRRVRIFTPGGEIPFAGHPTVGTAFVLASTGSIPLTGGRADVVFEEGVGPVRVSITADGNAAIFAELSVAQLPAFSPPPPDTAALARALGLDRGDLLTGPYAPEVVSCGLPFLFVPVRDRAALARARARLDEFGTLLGRFETSHVFLFCDEPERSGSTHRARMFAPLLGVTEDPATGSACAAFGGYLAARDALRDGTLRWIVEQGFEMGRPSILRVEADKRSGAITAVRVGGYSVLVTRGELTLD